jgi:hypothetical protein
MLLLRRVFSARWHAPCRNRTYNPVIKSHFVGTEIAANGRSPRTAEDQPGDSVGLAPIISCGEKADESLSLSAELLYQTLINRAAFVCLGLSEFSVRELFAS